MNHGNWTNYDHTDLTRKFIDEQFRPLAARYRQQQKQLGFAYHIGGALMALVALLLCFSWYLSGALLFFTALILIVVWIYHLAPFAVLCCPICKGYLEELLGKYCPECGAQTVYRDFLWSKGCSRCGATLFRRPRGGGRYFKIFYCNHCGVHLDERGL